MLMVGSEIVDMMLMAFYSVRVACISTIPMETGGRAGGWNGNGVKMNKIKDEIEFE